MIQAKPVLIDTIASFRLGRRHFVVAVARCGLTGAPRLSCGHDLTVCVPEGYKPTPDDEELSMCRGWYNLSMYGGPSEGLCKAACRETVVSDCDT